MITDPIAVMVFLFLAVGALGFALGWAGGRHSIFRSAHSGRLVAWENCWWRVTVRKVRPEIRR